MPPNTEISRNDDFITENLKKEVKYIPGKGFRKVSADPDYRPEINWLHVVILIGIPILAVYGIFTTPLQTNTLILFVITYFLGGFGITAGYHRLWSHKAYSATVPLKIFLLIIGASALQGSARWWCRNHRAHHKFTDTTKDPYNVRKGFWYAHFGWMMFKQNVKEVGRANIDDLDADALIRFQHNYYATIAVFWSVVVPTLIAGFGWGDFRGGYFYASLCRIFCVHHATFFVNSLAHYFGDQAYSDLHTAFDSVITALLTLGEGYHNYHHEFPQDYRNGIRWFHYDPTKWSIVCFYYLGLAYDLKWVPDNEIKKANLQIKQAKLDEFRNKVDHGRKFDKNLPVFTKEMFSNKQKYPALIVIGKRVYEVSEFLDLHPGGRETLSQQSGTMEDRSDLFNGTTGDHIHTPHANEILKRYLVGRIH